MRDRKRVADVEQPLVTPESEAIRELARQIGRVADELRTMNISRRFR